MRLAHCSLSAIGEVGLFGTSHAVGRYPDKSTETNWYAVAFDCALNATKATNPYAAPGFDRILVNNEDFTTTPLPYKAVVQTRLTRKC